MLHVYEYLKKCGHYFLATSEFGRPHVRPFETITVFDGRLYIQTGKKKSVSRQMKNNPRVELCGVSDGTWIRIEAEVELDERLEPQQAIFAEYPYLRKNYQAGDGNNEVFFLKNATAIIYSFTEDPRTIHF